MTTEPTLFPELVDKQLCLMPEGFRYQENIISEAEEAALAKSLVKLDLKPFEFHGHLGNRRVTSFGLRYDYARRAVNVTDGFPAFVADLRNKVAEFAGRKVDELQQGGVNEYAPRWKNIDVRATGIPVSEQAELLIGGKENNSSIRFLRHEGSVILRCYPKAHALRTTSRCSASPSHSLWRNIMLKKSFSALCIALPLFACTTMNAAPPPTDIETVVKKLDTYMKEKMAQTGVIGAAVAIVYKEKVVWLGGYGYRKVNGAEKVDADTVFKIASLSKPIASTIVASLIGTDGIRWDTPVHDYDSEFELSKAAATHKVTLRNFLSHSSGLPTTGGDVLEDLGYTRPEVLSKLRLVPLVGELGKTYHYSNFGFTEAANAVSIRLKKPWEKVAEDQLYSKLGMSSTSSRFSDYENSANKAAIHFADCDQEDHCVFRNWFTRDADAESPAGGVSSSARDLAKWLQMQLAGGSFNGRQIVERTALEETRKPVICKSVDVLQPGRPCPQNSYYGLGWGVGKTSWGATMNSHSGAFLLGTGTAVYMIPDEQIGIVIVTNSAPVGLPEAAALTFLDEYHYGKSTQDWLKVVQWSFVALRKEAQNSSPNYSEMKTPPSSTPSKGLSFYTGKYFNPFYGTLEVREEHSHLILLLPPRDAYYELEHWNEDTFTYFFATESSGVARRGAKFSGRQVLIESLAIENSGIFTKID